MLFNKIEMIISGAKSLLTPHICNLANSTEEKQSAHASKRTNGRERQRHTHFLTHSLTRLLTPSLTHVLPRSLTYTQAHRLAHTRWCSRTRNLWILPPHTHTHPFSNPHGTCLLSLSLSLPHTPTRHLPTYAHSLTLAHTHTHAHIFAHYPWHLPTHTHLPVTWHIDVCDVTGSYDKWHVRIHTWHKRFGRTPQSQSFLSVMHPYVWHGTSTCAIPHSCLTWLVHMIYDMTCIHVWHREFRGVPQIL